MEIIRMKQKQNKFQNIKHNESGLAFLESIVALVFLFPFIFEIMGIMDYYRISYTLEERINNEFGNRKEFAIKLDNNFKVKNLDDINNSNSNSGWKHPSIYSSGISDIEENKYLLDDKSKKIDSSYNQRLIRYRNFLIIGIIFMILIIIALLNKWL